jgi:DNA-binding HxlR family transcriptional regulator
VRAGAQTLTLLGTPRVFLILKSLGEGPKARLALRRDAGLPAQSTMRGHLESLEEIGAIVQRKSGSSPNALEYELAQPGQELLAVAASLERWLAEAPTKLELGGIAAKAAIKGLVDGWATSIVTTLAAAPMSLTELDKQISAVSYPTIERCLETMRLAEQLEVGFRGSRGTPYELTSWLRRGLTPLALAARWEHRHQPHGVASLNQGDIDGALLLGRPLFKLDGLDGVCELAVKIPEGKHQYPIPGVLEIRDGEMVFGAVPAEVKPDARASGTMDTWFATLIDADPRGLTMSGDRDLAGGVFDCLHKGLFGDEPVAADATPKSTPQG